MSFIGSTLLGGLNLSSSEKAFRPWWDNIEDNIVYTLVLLSLIVAPGSFILMSTLDCNYCQGRECQRHCEHLEDPNDWFVLNSCKNSEQNNLKDVYNAYFVKQYCSKTLGRRMNSSGFQDGLYISFLLAYFPYLLLLISGVLVLVDRPFVLLLFKSFNMEQLHKLLVLDDPFTEALDRKKETHELMSCLGSISNYFSSYLLRTVLSLVGSGVPLIFLIYNMATDTFFNNLAFICCVNSRVYECAGYPIDFYWGVLIIFNVLLSVYFLLNIWNLVWLLLPNLSSLAIIMLKYKRMKTSSSLDKLYFNNLNVQLLMGLLSASSGVANPLRSLALIDKNLNDALIPSVQIENAEPSPQSKPGSHVHFSVPRDSVLDHISKKTSCYVTFSLEYGDQAVHFPEFKGVYQVRVPVSPPALVPFAVSTSINGKIVALRKFEASEFPALHVNRI